MTETNGFLTALAAVQAEAPALPKDKTNPAFRGSKYTGLDTIVSTIGPLLTKHGLVWITKPGSNGHGPTLEYELLHVGSGEGSSGTMPLLLAKEDSQAFGSALTYARRYALCSVLNLVSDDDDDGNGAVARSQQAVQAVAHPWGEQATQAKGEQAFRALTFILDGTTSARVVWDEILQESSPDPAAQFFPASAARAIALTAKHLKESREAEPAEPAPEFDPISQKIAEEEFPAETIDPANANELLDAIRAKWTTPGDIKGMFAKAGITVTAPMLKTNEALLDVVSGLTVPQAGEVERLLKEMTT